MTKIKAVCEMTNDTQMHRVEIILKEMLDIQQKSQLFVTQLTEGESLSQNQLILLIQLKIHGGMKATEIADFFNVTPGAVTSMCDKLEKLHVVQRIREQEDRRVVKVVLAPAGEDKVRELFLKFSQEKLEEMAAVLLEVNQLMGTIIGISNK